MRKYLMTLGILSLALAMVGMLGSVAWAQGPPGVTAQVAELETGDEAALDELNGFGLAAVASGFLSDNIWGVEVQNLKANQEYTLYNNVYGEPSCTGQIGVFTTGPAGAAATSFMSTDEVKDDVDVCRISCIGCDILQVLTGTLDDLNQAVRGRRP